MMCIEIYKVNVAFADGTGSTTRFDVTHAAMIVTFAIALMEMIKGHYFPSFEGAFQILVCSSRLVWANLA
jgi:hypothetical protein